MESNRPDSASELDRRIYHLKTLYDVSSELFSSIDFDTILRNFLLMSMGNFGISKGAVFVQKSDDFDGARLISFGFDDENIDALKESSLRMTKILAGTSDSGSVMLAPEGFLSEVAALLPFGLADECQGLLILGDKLTGVAVTEDDKELLITLVNNLVVALRNACSFERISRLNVELQAKNEELETTLSELKAALRKVEILESIKSNLCKFVPTTLKRIIEDTGTTLCLDPKECDVSVMFLDIEGYTKITEQIGAAAVNDLVERYFSVFMDAIYTNNGDVLETSGDGLLVVFFSADERTKAGEAVRAALMIREQTSKVNETYRGRYQPLCINIGITSGPAVVGTNKFESYTGVRWTYTTHGATVNLAAHICSQARGGAVFLCKETAQRVKDFCRTTSMGTFALKNIQEPVEIFGIT